MSHQNVLDTLTLRDRHQEEHLVGRRVPHCQHEVVLGDQ